MSSDRLDSLFATFQREMPGGAIDDMASGREWQSRDQCLLVYMDLPEQRRPCRPLSGERPAVDLMPRQ